VPGGRGAATVEAWVAYALGVKARTAADYVRVAGAFRRLPLIHLAFRDGRFSFDQVQALVRVATPGHTGCRFPGCTRTRWIQAHHKRHRADGGRTDTDNLLLLCGAHHRFVHEGRVRIEGVPDGELAFFDRHGRPLVPGPRGLHPKVRRRMEVFVPRLPDWLAPAWLEPPPPWVRR
jgi:hypothetical protein